MAATAVGSWLGLSNALGADATRKPNVVLIVADDLGYADLGAQGLSKDVKTPHIDSLATNGARFTDAYVVSPVCSPCRAGLLTGRYPQRFGYEFNPGGVDHPNFGLPLSEITIADVLRRAGYHTGMLGKWHLGNKPPLSPPKRGFDEFYGFWGGAHAYLDHEKFKGMNTIRKGDTPFPEKEYLTDAIGREAAAFVDRNHANPFFLYVAFNAPHQPMQATEKYLDRFKGVEDRKRRAMLAMLSAMDDAVGQLLAKLREHNLEDNTLIYFISDNGGPTPGNASLNTPLSGIKADLLEGGIRVPFLVQWKGRIPAGQVIRQPVNALDIFTTSAAAGGADLPKDRVIDGVNLLPLLEGKTQDSVHDRLYWRYWPMWAVREGDWKVLGWGDKAELFNLAEDIGETKDVAAQHPDVLSRLRDAFTAWDKQLAKPLWLDPNHVKRPKEHEGQRPSVAGNGARNPSATQD